MISAVFFWLGFCLVIGRRTFMAKIFFLGLFLLSFTGCALNSADTPLGELKAGQNNDPDYFVNLWPEGVDQEPNPLLAGELKGWPAFDKSTVLFVGDSSLFGNWGLALQKTFEEKDSQNILLAGCNATAASWKSGSPADCLYVAPFTKLTENRIHLTQDMQAGSDRALPLILGNTHVNKIVLSFGSYLKDISDSKTLQEELIAIEILAKWAHSAGKTCYYVSPSGEFFLESGVHNVASEILTRLKITIDPYCYWVDASEARATFLEETQIKVEDKVKEVPPSQAQADQYIRIDEPPAVEVPVLPPLVIPNLNLDTSNMPDIIEDKKSTPREATPQTPEDQKSDGPPLDTSKDIPNTDATNDTPKDTSKEGVLQDATAEPKAGDKKVVNVPFPVPRPEGLGTSAATENSGATSTPEDSVAEQLKNLKPEDIPRPEPRPQFLLEQDQQAIREQIEQSSANVAKAENKTLRYQEPKYLWNGYAQGSNYTKIGKEELDRYGKSMFEATKLSDATTYCPNYWNLSKADRKNVWLFLYSAMALYESTFNSGAKAVEVSGGTSVGLFQMDYNNCKQSASKPQDLTNPRINFRCAIRKSAFLVKEGSQIANGSYPSNCNQQGCSYRGGAMDRFWSTLRKPYKARIQSKGKLVQVTVGKRPQVINHLKGLPHCKK